MKLNFKNIYKKNIPYFVIFCSFFLILVLPLQTNANPLSSDTTLSTFTIGGQNTLDLFGLKVANPETETGARLEVQSFTGFAGIVATPNHIAATRTVHLNGSLVTEGNLATQSIVKDDTILVTVTAENSTVGYYKVTAIEPVVSDFILKSNKYKIISPQISPGADFLTNEDNTLSMFGILGRAFFDPRLHSDSYKTIPGDVMFEPFIPSIQCFETNTDGESDCTNGPGFLNTGGMARVCGPNGCYNRARFEINNEGNPIDTLYGVQISEDSFEIDVRYIDGNTLQPKDDFTIEDYKTKLEWEENVFNLIGLKPDTEYSLRVTALYGNLTESLPSEVVSASTSKAIMEFRIGFDNGAGENINYNPPYELIFDEGFTLIRGASAQTSDRLIWTLINTNAIGGIAVVQKGEYGGLYSALGAHTINSLTGDLNLANEGIGLKNRVIRQLYNTASNEGLLSSISTQEDYNSEENNFVGIIDTIFKKIYESDGPLYSGETAMEVKTKVALNSPEGEYIEDLTLVLVAKY